MPLVLGLLATAAIRPHVTVLLVGGLIAAVAIRRPRRRTILTPVVKVGGIVAVTGMALVAFLQAAQFVGVEEISVDALQSRYNAANAATGIGGSSFSGAAVGSPLDLPWATVSVLFRPFPWEARGPLPLLASLEGLFLVALAWQARGRLLRVPQVLSTRPYLVYSLIYLILYVVMFSGFANFGILVRQRALVLPAFFVFMALPRSPADSGRPRYRSLKRTGWRQHGHLNVEDGLDSSPAVSLVSPRLHRTPRGDRRRHPAGAAIPSSRVLRCV